MNYGIIAGLLVTLSLILLVVETAFDKENRSKGRSFVVLYGSGVSIWLMLGIAMDQTPLVIISFIQLFCIALLVFLETHRS